MLTPRFELTQTVDEVTVTVHAPYARIKDTEVYVEDYDFRFYSAPYYLRLNLPGKIVENDSSSGSYDAEKGDFTLRFSKVNKGEEFQNLDMITTLLAPPKKRTQAVPTIEVISNPVVSLAEEKNGELQTNEVKCNSEEATVDGENRDGDEWFLPQNINQENIQSSIQPPNYGFGGKFSRTLASFESGWTGEIIDLPAPDVTPSIERACLRQKHEFEQFSEEHYMADLIQEEYIRPYIDFKAEWESLKSTEITLSDTEKDLLKELPNKEYLLDSKEVEKITFGLVDILFGSCYNHRTTMGENTVESGWTINKLSSTLCWFQEFNNMEEVVTACVRRSLCYPLYRNWELSVKVLNDVKIVLSLGKKYVVKRLCEIHELFNNSYEPRYMLNHLYIKDYLIWLQQTPSSLIESLSVSLSTIHPNKVEMGLDLVELEAAAFSVQDEDLVIENAIHEMVDKVGNMALYEKNDEKPKFTYTMESKKFLDYLLRRGSSSSSDSSDTDSETESDSSSSSSTSTDESLDSDDTSEVE
ncbi:protein SHQ1 homolog isoform X1 [Neodiprion virginianus]|uniref:protein SHQ1 homolog isoform X1 n=1 Tax=Neodiprion virginianus TaxID=2961670 RepID=UPI001EE6D72A|nr:protein SHQ1 homolog isoform X1 [Neodiprion virginianus]